MHIKSYNSGFPARPVFVNNTEVHVRVLWLNYQGCEVRQKKKTVLSSTPKQHAHELLPTCVGIWMQDHTWGDHVCHDSVAALLSHHQLTAIMSQTTLLAS